MSDRQWLTVKQAAEYVTMSEATIRRAAASGELSGAKRKPGVAQSQWRFRPADLDRWLERGRIGATKRRAS